MGQPPRSDSAVSEALSDRFDVRKLRQLDLSDDVRVQPRTGSSCGEEQSPTAHTVDVAVADELLRAIAADEQRPPFSPGECGMAATDAPGSAAVRAVEVQ